jgi:hypothetical protein
MLGFFSALSTLALLIALDTGRLVALALTLAGAATRAARERHAVAAPRPGAGWSSSTLFASLPPPSSCLARCPPMPLTLGALAAGAARALASSRDRPAFTERRCWLLTPPHPATQSSTHLFAPVQGVFARHLAINFEERHPLT